MTERSVEMAQTTPGLPVSPGLGPSLEQVQVPVQAALVDRRVVFVCVLSVALAVFAAVVARVLVHLIALVTNVSFFGLWSLDLDRALPAENNLGLWVIVIPAAGGLVVGLMARFGSKAIRGHGIPEAMEQVLTNESRIPARMTFLKPLSSAVAIGTGGPFGAEGPIIATGGALGSLVGQVLHTTASERKTLLAAGAAAGMAAVFGSPVSAVLLAVELLLFEFRPRSIIPVALAAATAAACRMVTEGADPVFPMPDLVQPGGAAMAVYVFLGAVIGVIATAVTRLVYAAEDGFERIPVHWMWWPAIGGLVVGAVGFIEPRTLGVGYSNISDVLSDRLSLSLVASLCLWKFISWSIALGSGTSGGTLAPLFTIGGALGALLGAGVDRVLPQAHVDPHVAALVGMAAIFAGASRALLASAVFAFETTLQPLGLLPLLGGCTAAYLVSSLLMPNSIMTEKIARRGVRVPAEYHADELDRILVRDVVQRPVVTLRGDQAVAEIRDWMQRRAPGSQHQGYPIVDGEGGRLIGVLTRRDLLDPETEPSTLLRDLIRRRPSIVYEDSTLRHAADHMITLDIGRLPVTRRGAPGKVVGIVTRGDLIRAQWRRVQESQLGGKR